MQTMQYDYLAPRHVKPHEWLDVAKQISPMCSHATALLMHIIRIHQFSWFHHALMFIVFAT